MWVPCGLRDGVHLLWATRRLAVPAVAPAWWVGRTWWFYPLSPIKALGCLLCALFLVTEPPERLEIYARPWYDPPAGLEQDVPDSTQPESSESGLRVCSGAGWVCLGGPSHGYLAKDPPPCGL